MKRSDHSKLTECIHLVSVFCLTFMGLWCYATAADAGTGRIDRPCAGFCNATQTCPDGNGGFFGSSGPMRNCPGGTCCYALPGVCGFNDDGTRFATPGQTYCAPYELFLGWLR